MTFAERFKWSRLSLREKGLSLLTLAAVLYAFVVFVYNPKVAERRRLNTQITALQNEVTTLSSALSTLQKKDAAAEGEDPSRLGGTGRRALIDSNPSLSRLFEEINRLARLRKVRLLELKPSVVEKKEQHEILPLQLKARSRFRDFGMYLLSLEGFPQPVVVDRIKIRSTPQTSPEIVAEITLHFYKKGDA
ncbi:MAG: type 4a pilus biogenesis protein PilO [Nitrospiria bacterium]